MNPPIISPEILMDEEELCDSDLTPDQLRAYESIVGGKYHDMHLRRRDDDA